MRGRGGRKEGERQGLRDRQTHEERQTARDKDIFKKRQSWTMRELGSDLGNRIKAETHTQSGRENRGRAD